MLSLTGEDRTNLDRLNGRLVDAGSSCIGDFLTGLNDDLVGGRVNDIVHRHAAHNALAQRRDNVVLVLDLAAHQSTQGATVLLGDDHVVGHVDETACEITGIGGLQSGVGKTLAGTVRRDEVLQHRQTLLEVSKDGVLDNLLSTLDTRLLRLGHLVL